MREALGSWLAAVVLAGPPAAQLRLCPDRQASVLLGWAVALPLWLVPFLWGLGTLTPWRPVLWAAWGAHPGRAKHPALS